MKGSFSFLLILILAVSVCMSKAEDEATTTAGPSLPQRIRDAIYNSIRTLGNVVRFVPATITDSLRNISRTSSEALRRNSTIKLINPVETTTTTSSPSPSTSGAPPS